MPPHEGFFNSKDLDKVVDCRLVECIGGPRDGETRRLDSNMCERDGVYIPVNVHVPPGYFFVRELQWMPDE